PPICSSGSDGAARSQPVCGHHAPAAGRALRRSAGACDDGVANEQTQSAGTSECRTCGASRATELWQAPAWRVAEQLMAQFPSRIQAALLFDAAQPLDMDSLVREFLAAEAATGTQYKLVYDTKPGVFYRLFGSNDVMITVEHVGRQAQLPLFEAAL